MSILVEELWSQSDEWSLDLFIGAAAQDDLARALLALEGVGSKDRQRTEGMLEDWAAMLHASSEPPPEQAALLGALLVGELDLRGDQVDYTLPTNSYISQVITRRRGLPILLSVIWMEVGRRAGISVEGIGLPGHFIVRVGGAQGEYVDPFGGGVVWSPEDCRRVASQSTFGQVLWDESFLEPVDSQELLKRVCRNLVAAQGHLVAQGQQSEHVALYRTLRFLEAMAPDEVDVPLLRARVAESCGAYPRAIQIYRAIATHHADTEEAQEAEGRLQSLSRLVVAKS